MFDHYNRLGFMTPYYVWRDGRIVTRRTYSDIIGLVDGPRRIDATSVIEIVSRYFCFADRTLVEGIYRTPWMARPNSSCTEWAFAPVPSHDQQLMPADEVAKNLFDRLQQEILDYCKSHSKIGLLLSGGMDSRIVAGTMDFLIRTGQLSADVLAITWGTEDSRDVVYAREIARRLDWAWRFYRLSPDNLLENISYAAERGCEYSPIHLDAMPRVREIEDLDCIVAASYGDSVGRGEYSGRHIAKKRAFHNHTFNWFGLLQRTVVSEALHNRINQDIERYRLQFPRGATYQEREIDQQAHYWRRMLNPTFAVIDEMTPVLQAFSSPSVFGFMWSLAPEARNDKVYRHMLDLFSTDLSDIPWSRTGLPYLSSDGISDGYSRLHAPYGKWIRQEIYGTIRQKVTSSAIERLGLFNMESIRSCLDVSYRFANQDGHTKLDEILIWIASLADFVELYGVEGAKRKSDWLDNLSGKIVAPLEATAVLGLNKMRGYG